MWPSQAAQIIASFRDKRAPGPRCAHRKIPNMRAWHEPPGAVRKIGRPTHSRGDSLPTTGRGARVLGASLIRDNILYLIIGALVIVVAALGYQLYQDRKQPEGMRIDLGPNGLSIEKK
jgi:hypothetical protein